MSQGTGVPLPFLVAEDATGARVSGAKANFYAAGTATRITTYSNVELTVQQANPVVASIYGNFAQIFLAPGVAYDLDMTTSAGVSLPGYPVVDQLSIPLSENTIAVEGTVGEAVTANQSVYLSDGSGSKTAGKWYLTDADNDYASVLPQIGVVPADIALNASGVIQQGGRIEGYTGLTIGANYFLSTTAGAKTTTPTNNTRYIGQADSTTSLVLSPNPPVGGRLIDFTPSFLNTGTANSLGNGTLTGKHLRLGDLLFINIAFLRGSTTTMGNGIVYFGNLPVAGTLNEAVGGGGYARDSGTGDYSLSATIFGSSTTAIILRYTDIATGLTANLTATTPMTWATGDSISYTGFFRIV